MENVNGRSNPGMIVIGESSKKCKSVLILPPELIMEILSWLPLKPLVRAQLVCKEWRALIQDHQFLEKHLEHTSYVDYWYNVTNLPAKPAGQSSFCYLHGCDGLILMKNNTTKIHFLWNPATRLAVQLPSPHIGSYGCALSFVPATKNYKIFSFFKDKLASGKHGCQVVTAGASMQWRQLPFPDVVYANSQLEALLVPAGGAVHRVVLTKDGVAEIISVDVDTELVALNRLPAGIFRDTQSARAIDCDGKLGFGVIVGQELQLMVLEDYKKNRWGRNKQVIPLPFLKDEGYKGMKVAALLIKQGEILFCLEDQKISAYTIETGKISDIHQLKRFSLCLWNKLYSYKPSMVTFEGMQADDELDSHRPKGMKLD